MSSSETGGHQSVKTVGPHWGLVNCLYGPSPGRKAIARLSGRFAILVLDRRPLLTEKSSRASRTLAAARRFQAQAVSSRESPALGAWREILI